MAENVTINPTTTSGGAVIHTDELSSGAQVQRIKIGTGNPGVYTDVSSSNPFPVTGDVSVGNTVAVSNAGLTELAAAINANELDVNLASSNATVTVTGTVTATPSGVQVVSDGAVVSALGGTLTVSDGAVVSKINTVLGNSSLVTSGAIRVNLDSSNVALGGGTEYSVGTALADEAGLGKLGLYKRDDALGGLTEVEGTLVPGRVDANGAIWVVSAPGDAETTDGASIHSLGVTRQVNVGFVSDPNELSVGANTVGMAGMNSERAIYVSIREDTVGIGGASTASDGTTHSLLQGTLTVSDGAVVSALGGTLTVDLGSNNDIQGQGAHDAAVTGNPVVIGARATNSIEGITQVANADAVRLAADLNGVLVTRAHTTPEENISENASATSTGSIALSTFGAGGAGVHNFVTDITITNSSATDSVVQLRDGTSGSVMWTFPAPANSGATHSFSLPLKQATANTALAWDPLTAATTIYISLNGFQAQG